MPGMSPDDDLLPDPLPSEPLALALAWQQRACHQATQPNPDAIVLATVSADGQPSARVVLCKEIVPVPGYLTFYTNYQSAKGRQLAANARAAVVMHWDHLQRQVRVEGRVTSASAANSDAYFATRYWLSRVGAWASQQSQPLDRRETLEREMTVVAARFDARGDDAVIPRPPHWGGYHLWAERVELWIAGGARIHERALWSRSLRAAGAGFTPSAWNATRLQP
jgi:pyridoxamine 5'-phosphate oxidase